LGDNPTFVRIFSPGFDRLAEVDLVLDVFPSGVGREILDEFSSFLFDGNSDHKPISGVIEESLRLYRVVDA